MCTKTLGAVWPYILQLNELQNLKGHEITFQMTPNVHIGSKYFFVKITFEYQIFDLMNLSFIKIWHVIHQNEALDMLNAMVHSA